MIQRTHLSAVFYYPVFNLFLYRKSRPWVQSALGPQVFLLNRTGPARVWVADRRTYADRGRTGAGADTTR